MNDEGWIVWLTGLPASGKTTIGRSIQVQLRTRGIPSIVLDSDELRPILTPRPTYSSVERAEFYGQLAQVALLLARQGTNIIIAATAHRRLYRVSISEQLKRFYEVWIDCPLGICQARDPKGLYAMAAQETNTTLPGVGTVYEPPDAPAVVIRSDQLSPEDAASMVIEICKLSAIHAS